MKHKRGRYEETTDASHMCNAQCAILNQLLRSMQRAFLKIFEGRISNELKEVTIKTKKKKKENNISKEKQISHKKNGRSFKHRETEKGDDQINFM